MERGSRLVQILAAVTISLTKLMAGVVIAWPSPLVPRLVRGREQVTITADEGSSLASIPLLAGIPLFVVLAFSFDIIGRKTWLLLTAPLFVVGFTWQIFARTYWELLLSRVVLYLSSPMILVAMPVYLVEISEDDVRGAMLASCQLMMSLGSLIVHSIGPYLSLAALSCVFASLPVLFFISFVWMPESPYYLLKKGLHDDATKSLLRLRGYSDSKCVKEELEKIECTLRQQQEQRGTLRDLFLHRGNRRTLLIMVGFEILCNCTGILAVVSYMNEVFHRASASLDADVSAIILSGLQLVFSALVPLVVDRVGRRPLLLVSFSGCSLALVSEGIYFYLKDVAGSDVSCLGWLPLMGLVVFLMSYSFGAGCFQSTLCCELFAISVKGLATSFLAIIYILSCAGTVKLFQMVADEAGIHVIFWSFASCSAIGALYSYLLIPETKKKSLMLINSEINLKVGIEKPSDCAL